MPEPMITTSRTPRHALPYLFPGQAQKEAFVNEALARLDALLQPAVLGELNAPPADPAPGDCYIVGASPTGAWVGHEGSLATWAESLWLLSVPNDGSRVHDSDSGALLAYSEAAGWRGVRAPALPGGGTTQDAEARAAIAAIVDGLRALGIFSD